MALILQHPPETHGFTSIELVLTGRYPHLRRMEIEGQEDRAIAREAIRQTATAQFESRAVSSLSGGERQRLFIARGLAQRSPVLLLDEPTASLDVRHQLAMFELFRSLAEAGRTLVVAVHDLELAARYCHRLVLMDEGRIVTSGEPRDVLTPEHLSEVFRVSASVYQDPNNGALRVTFDPMGARGGDAVRPGTSSGYSASERGGRHV
jgi:iron complex transport system ATP-binding protein